MSDTDGAHVASSRHSEARFPDEDGFEGRDGPEHRRFRRSSSDVPPRATPYKKTLCRHWQAGNCRNGHRCTFSHGVEDLQGTRGILCRFFLRGVCKHGRDCPYMHPSGSRMALPSDVSTSPYYGVSSASSQYPQPSTGYKTDLCVNRNSHCSAGAYCGYAHSVDELLPGKFTLEEIAALRQAASSSAAVVAPSPYGQYYVAMRDPAGGVYGQPAVVTAPVVAANRPSSSGGEEAAAVYAAYAGYSPSSYASAASTGASAGGNSSASVSARHTELYFPAASSSSSNASGSGAGNGGSSYHHVQHPAGSSSDPGERTVMLPTSRRLCNFWPHGCRKGDACPFVHEASLVHPHLAGSHGTRSEMNGGARSYPSSSPYGREYGHSSRGRPRSRSPVRGGSYPFRVKECLFYKQGSCRRGDACTFLHRSRGDVSPKSSRATNGSGALDSGVSSSSFEGGSGSRLD
ncbi:zinc finger (ccch type) motif-containing protein [Cystoisospora suis]|uniref:Zinc finger (Ccch type) motif-containing protein n=1 Tax=Cystoisospora suis TaxID=483139 RepID=A0A2C6KG54_9APIC|nr:zinc finger (ccch type) motif-containing protein [Cystoisospora suis]